MDLNILIVGVGGQGTLLASRVLGQFATGRGLDCKLSEVHGMAQRGGSVVTHVRIAKKVYSPVIAEGRADIIIAFEELEALRARHYLSEEGIMIVNSQEIYPMPVIIGAVSYPENPIATIKSEGKNVITLNALDLAKECGNIKASNTVMIGKMAKILDIPLDEMKEVLKVVVPERFIELNLLAVEKGYNS